MAVKAPPPALQGRRLEVETPEHVAIGYALADLGSRFAALLLDTLILALLMLAVLLGVPLLVSRVGTVPQTAAGWGTAVLLLVVFALVWGYFVFWEGLRDGQTPGKRAVGIRVVHDGGHPLTLRGAAVRNLLRVVDIQPIPSWLVGGVAILLHPRGQRLGDMAAGSLVVRESAAAELPEEAAEVAERTGPPQLAAQEFALLSRYASRRAGLAAEPRQRLARQVAAALADPLAADSRSRGMTPDRFLALLYQEESARRAMLGGGTPQAAALVRGQRRRWSEYRALLALAGRRGLRRLPEAEVTRFAALYRETAADLARARTYGASDDLTYSLERWVGAGHNLLYRPAERSWRLLGAWLAIGFPRLVRRLWRPIALAAVFLYLPAVLAFAAVRAEPLRARSLLPAEMIARAETAPERGRAGGGYVDVPEVFMPVMASGIVANNVQVTFVAFAGGILAGIGTALILLLNGVHLGAAAALFANHGAALQLWTFVLPHGTIELTAICIAGGAGLWLGSALLAPGRRSRRDILVERGRDAVALIGGTTVLLLVAGSIEGFISPSPLPGSVKLLAAALFALLLLAYLLLPGSERDAELRAARGASPPDND
ncbi:MAG: stage II sporulation protein M [Longimicrobiaceae bacterium]